MKYTPLFLIMAYIAAYDSLGALEDLIQKKFLYRNGDNTIDGTITGTDGESLKLVPSYGVVLDELVFNATTVANEEALSDLMQTGGLRYGVADDGGQLSNGLYLKHNDQLIQQMLASSVANFGTDTQYIEDATWFLSVKSATDGTIQPIVMVPAF